MKLKCNNCGEIVESGIVNVSNHVLVECKAATTERVSSNFLVTYRPPANFTPLEELGEEKNNLVVSE